MTSHDQRLAAGTAGPVLAGLIGTRTAESVLRTAFAEARRLVAPVRVVIAEPAADSGDDAHLVDLIERWAHKYPAVPVTTSFPRGLDA